MAVTRLDTAASVAATTQTFSVSAGTDRMLVVCTGHEVSGQVTVDSVDYGGQAMVQAVQLSTPDTGFAQAESIWYLLEAGIDAATDSVITPSWSAAPDDTQIHAASYENVNQTGGGSTLTATATAESNESTPNPLISDLTEDDEGVVVAVRGSGNASSFTWASDMTEQTDQIDASSGSSCADRLSTTGGNVNIEGTASSQNRGAQVAAAFAVAPTGAHTATGAPSITIPTASGTATVGRSATGAVVIALIAAAGVAEVINTATGAPVMPLIEADGTAAVAFSPKANQLRVTFPTPTTAPADGAGLQRFRIRVRRNVDLSGSGVPTMDVFLYEGGVQRGAILVDDANVTADDPGQIIEAPWDAVDLVTGNGSDVECFITTTVGGAGGDARSVEIGAVEWCTVAGEGGITATGAPAAPLPTAAGVAQVTNTATGAPSIPLPVAAGVAEVLNTATGAPEIPLPTAAGAAEVIHPATGAPEITIPTAAGAAEVINAATGAPSIPLPTAAGTTDLTRFATGAPSIPLPIAAGAAEVIHPATGAPQIALIEADGFAEIKFLANGAPEIAIPTAAGTTALTRKANGAPAITMPTAAGTVPVIDRSATGAPSITPIEADGTATAGTVANGAPEIAPIEAAGTTALTRKANGAPSIPLPTAAGVAETINTATGAPEIPLPTAAGAAQITKPATGAPEIPLPTAAGLAEVGNLANGAPSIPLPTAAGTTALTRFANGAPSIPLPIASGTTPEAEDEGRFGDPKSKKRRFYGDRWNQFAETFDAFLARQGPAIEAAVAGAAPAQPVAEISKEVLAARQFAADLVELEAGVGALQDTTQAELLAALAPQIEDMVAEMLDEEDIIAFTTLIASEDYDIT